MTRYVHILFVYSHLSVCWLFDQSWKIKTLEINKRVSKIHETVCSKSVKKYLYFTIVSKTDGGNNIIKIPFVNMRPMGHIAHLRNQFEKNENIWAKLWLYIIQNWPSTFKFRECNFAISLLSPVVKRCGLSMWTN